ncbi:MAG: hypothetical protein AB7D05_08640 [Mangrovibacterium sp.]
MRVNRSTENVVIRYCLARQVNRLTPHYCKIYARDLIIENSSRFIKVVSIPESPLNDFLIENAEVNCKELIRLHDAVGVTLRNINVNSEDGLIGLLDSRYVLFDRVNFETEVPLQTKVKGNLCGDIRFKDCSPEKPEGWPGPCIN